MCERDVIVMSERDQGVIVIYYYAQISGGACDLEHGYILYSQKLIHVVDIWANHSNSRANTWSKAPTLRERARLLDQNQSGRKARHIGDAG